MRNDDAISIKVFGTKCEAIVYEHAGYKEWKATFKTGVYPFNAFKAKGAKSDKVSFIVVQKVADENADEHFTVRLAQTASACPQLRSYKHS